MNCTINISLPTQLKQLADAEIKSGKYASFSDLVRTAIRIQLNELKYEQMWAQTKIDRMNGDTKVIQNKEDINKYFNDIAANANNRNYQKIRQRVGKIRQSNSTVQKNSKNIFSNTRQLVTPFASVT